MSATDVFFLIAIGVFAGFINTIAGGGSLLTMPLLIFMGFPSSEANGTNKIALLMQTFFSVVGFKSKGVFVFPFAAYVALPAVAGAIIGSKIAVDISDQIFNRILAIVMLLVILATVFKPAVKKIEKDIMTGKKIWLSVIIFFLIGIYGGFIQAGVGFIMIAALTGVHHFNMAKTNSIKVFVAFCYNIAAVIVFYLEGKIRWEYGLTLAVGNSTGAWIGSRWSVGQSDKIIRIILLVMISVLSVKLWFFS